MSFDKTRTVIDTAALDQPGDEGRAYGRTSSFWQRWTVKSACST